MAGCFRVFFHELSLAAILTAAGCAVITGHPAAPATSAPAEGLPSQTAVQQGAASSQSGPSNVAPPAASQSSGVSSQPLNETAPTPASLPTEREPQSESRREIISVDLLVSELEAEGLLDSEAKAQLTADLCRTPPHLWQGVVDAFRAGLELRKRRNATTQFDSDEVFIEDNRVRPASCNLTTPPGSSRETRLSSQDGPSNTNRGPLPEGSNSPSRTAAEDRGFDNRTDRVSPTQGNVQPALYPEQQPSSVSNSADSQRLSDRQSSQREDRSQSKESSPPSSLNEQSTGHWNESVRKAIQGLESQQTRNVTEEIQLRLLRLALTNREGALEPIPGLSPSLQDFWSQTLFGVLLLEDTQLHTDRQLRLVEARRHLENGIRRLAEECPVEITGLAFVTSVQSWGVYEAFDQYEFSPGQKVLLYAEVENLASESTAKGYRTAWRSSYQILDATGKQVANYEYPPNEEYCRRPRRDFFIGCELSFPKDVPPGRYTLRLTVVDMIKQRVGQGTVDFTLRAQQPR